MTEQRKIQLATEVDASGAAAGFEQVKSGVRDMAQVVSKAGQTAGKGLDAIGDGARRAADGFTREEGRMRSAIQRATVDLQTLGRAASEKLEAKINLQGLDPAKFQPYLTALRQVEEAQRSAAQKQQSSAAADAFTDSLRGQIAALREQIKLQSMSADEVLRYKAAQSGAAESAAPLILQLRNMQAAQEAVAQAARDAAAAQKQAAVEAGRRSSFLDGLKQQSEAIGKTRADLLEMQAAQMGVASAAAPYIAKLREAEKGHQGLGASGKLATWQLQQMGFQMHDFAVQVFSGQNVLTAFVQQGSQLSGTFGGAGNAFRAVLSTLTPMRLAMGGAAAAVGLLAMAMSHAETAARSLGAVQAQLAGTGREGLFSDKELRDFLNELTQAPGVSREAATAIVSEFAKVKEVGGDVFRDLSRSVADYARVTGTDLPTAARTLAKAAADPEKGIRQLDDALGKFSSKQIQAVQDMARAGDKAGALRVMVDALKEATNGAASSGFTPLQNAVDKLGNAWERALRQMDNSDGLRNLNALLGATLGIVTALVKQVDKLGGIGNIGVGMIPGAFPAAVGEAIGGPVRGLIFGKDETVLPSGQLARQDRAAGLGADGSVSVSSDKTASEKIIKQAQDRADSFKSEARQLAELRQERDKFTKALQASIAIDGPSGKAVQDRLRDAIAGVDERIAAAGKKGGNEAQQVLDAQLQQRIKATQDALQQERDQLAFSQRFLQGVYQAGELSLVDFFDQKRKAIERGTAAEIAALEKERADVQAHMEATRKTSPKDKSSLERDENRLREIDAQQEKLRLNGQRDAVLVTQEQTAATRQLNEQVSAYRANLLQLQGDEVGAAKIRADIAIEQARILASQAAKSGTPITAADQAATKLAIEQTNDIAAARNRLTVASQALAIQEERISMLQRSGAVGELEALQQVGAARAAKLTSLEKEVAVIEKLAAERPLDLQLNLDASRARLELESLKSQIDPLKDKFDGIFRDAGANLFSDLATGSKPRDAIKAFANSIHREISAAVGNSLSMQVFGKNGAFGGAGGMFADLFGGKDRNKLQAAVDTSGVTQSLSSMKLAGIDPATDALARLTAAAEATAVSLRTVTGTDLPLLAGTTGDFARLDRGQPPTTGEESTMDLFRDAGRSAERLTESNAAAASSVVRLANAAANGTSAMSALPSVVQSIIAAAHAASASSSGGGFLGGLASMFGSSSSSAGVNVSGMSGMSADTLALFGWSTGGYTGDVDPRKPAGIVHGKEYVFSEPAVRAIGVDRLERLHRKAKTGRMQGEEGIPGYADGGYVAVLGDRPQALRNNVQYLAPPQQQQPVKGGDTYVTNHHHNITMQATPGMSRATANQLGSEAVRGGMESARRLGKRV